MDNERKKYLGAKFRSAASSGRKVHVISREGNWIIFKEEANKVVAEYTTRQSAISNAQKILQSGEVEALVVHKKDGTVYKVQSLKNKAM